MDINSKKMHDSFEKIREFKNIVLIATTSVLFTLIIVMKNKVDALIIIMLTIWIGLCVSCFINNMKKIFLLQHIHELVNMDYTVFQILDKTNEESDINMVLGKKYKKLLERIYKIEEYIYNSVLKGKQSEAMADRIIIDVSKNLINPIDNISSKVEILKSNDYSSDILDDIEGEVYTLKNTMNELFELSKVVTNDMDLNIEKININYLIKQSLIEYDYKLNESELKLKKNIPSEKIFVNADGEKLWRVFEILLDNIVKHSRENTRVYIEVKEDIETIYVSLNNISKNSLNISGKEFFDRLNSKDCFGLPIATNLIDIQGGKLNIEIDGDMFKVILEFKNKYKDERGEK